MEILTLKQAKCLEKGCNVKKRQAAEKSRNFQLQDSEEKTANKLSSSVMGHILNSSSSSVEYEDTEYKLCKTKNTIISQDSPSTSQMRTTLQNLAQACDRTGVSYKCGCKRYANNYQRQFF